MQSMKKNRIGTYQDDSGNIYEVVECVSQPKVIPTSTGRVSTLECVRDYKTSCGKELNVGHNGSFVTLKGVILTPV